MLLEEEQRSLRIQFDAIATGRLRGKLTIEPTVAGSMSVSRLMFRARWAGSYSNPPEKPEPRIAR